MKIGDRLSVSIEGVEVAEAVIEDIEDGQATIVIPATRLVAQMTQNLDLAATKQNDGPDRVFTGTQTDTPEHTVEAPQTPSEAAPAPAPTPVPMQSTVAPEQPVRSLRDMDFDTSALDKE